MEVDLSNLPRRVCQQMDEIFRKDFDLSVLKAIDRQTRTAAARRDRLRWQPDMKPEYEIDPVIDSLWSRFYGHNYKENGDLMKFLMMRNPEIKLKPRSHQTMVGFEGSLKAEGGRRKTEGGGRNGKTGCRFGPGTLKLAS